jgi:Tfp pilus assembly protein PilN
MSTLTARETATGLATLPRVNLLPPEIEQQRQFKKVQAGLGLGVAASVAIVGALFLAASSQVSGAQSDLDTQTAKSTLLQADAAKYSDVPAVYAQVDAAKSQLDQAMGKEIRWSRFLNDLSINTPSKVWLTNITATEVVDTPAVATAAAPGTAATYGTPNIGTLTFEGKGYTHNDVAAWLKSLASEEGLADPFFTKSTQEKIGTEDSVAFTSQAVITEDLLSGRFSDKAGS